MEFKYVSVIAALVAISAGSPLNSPHIVPSTPGDNSHYVEGVSRYIWMPDGDGVPHLVDLEASEDTEILNNRNGANNEYWLYTRRNPTNAQILVDGNINSVRNSNYNPNLPLKVIVHGWNSNGNSGMNPQIRDAFLAVEDVNVIVLDWRRLANSIYLTAARGVPGVGQYLGNFLVWLLANGGGNWNNVHLIGFSLGAHVVGNAGRQAGGRPARVTGLDPAGPTWGGNSNALNRQSGVYVESIHTDGGSLGIMDPISDVDFYPNGGRSQPGCWVNTCNHGRAPEYFAASVRYNSFQGNQCNSLSDARNLRCTGSAFNMGNGVLSKKGLGLFALRTTSRWPFF